MKNSIKTSQGNLQKRGYAAREDIDLLRGMPFTDLINLLHAQDAVNRTSAAVNLSAFMTEETAVKEMLRQLCVESCLYTRLAICDSLQSGDEITAGRMTEYLGKIGHNQHKVPPASVSAKKSYPLPRDIIARALGKMKPEVCPVLFQVLNRGNTAQVSEVLDAIGFMVFYNQELATQMNVREILAAADRYKNDSLILWKAVLCLSAFPLKESMETLNLLAGRGKLQDEWEDIITEEAKRSLNILSNRK